MAGPEFEHVERGAIGPTGVEGDFEAAADPEESATGASISFRGVLDPALKVCQGEHGFSESTGCISLLSTFGGVFGRGDTWCDCCCC